MDDVDFGQEFINADRFSLLTDFALRIIDLVNINNKIKV